MTQATGTAVIDAPLATIRKTLLAAPQLPVWNPAFVRVTGAAHAALGTVYQLEAIRGMRGTLTYSRVEDHVVAFDWHVPLLSEEGVWELSEQGRNQTAVTHTVQRQGALAVALAPALRTLPRLRLERLAQHTSVLTAR